MPDQQRRTRRQFTPEFKRDAVELVRTSGRPVAEIARSWASTTRPLATGSARTASTAASRRG
jgi:transposase-like protein